MKFKGCLLAFALSACVSEGSFKEAERSEKIGRYPTAIQQYEDFFKLHSRSSDAPRALFRIGEIYRLVIGDFPKARSHYRNIVEWFPQSPWAKSAGAALMNCPDYFPFEARGRIFGDSQSGGDHMRTVETIEPLKDQPNRIRLKREILAGEAKVSSVELEYEKQAMELKEFQAGNKSGTVIFQFPLAKGKVWETVKENKRVTFTVEDDNAFLDVKAGTFTGCVKLKIQQAEWPDTWKVEYYAPWTGLVLASNATQKRETRIMELLPPKAK